jgi:hypothetical protein
MTEAKEVVARPDVSHISVPATNSVSSSPEAEVSNGVTTTQAEALRSVGINPALVPVKFSPEQIICFVGVLGQERVDAIVAGAIPTPTEFFTAKNCI